VFSFRNTENANRGAWSREALVLTEVVAGDCTREVVAWSVLYVKELPETQGGALSGRGGRLWWLGNVSVSAAST